jgi:hypothetical protein
MGNGVALIDEEWVEHSRPGILAACPVRIAPPEELIWHRLFISERHRHDMSDIVHLMLCCGDTIDWERLVNRVGEHWPLLSQILCSATFIPATARIFRAGCRGLLERARVEVGRNSDDMDHTRGPLISRFSLRSMSANGDSTARGAS